MRGCVINMSLCNIDRKWRATYKRKIMNKQTYNGFIKCGHCGKFIAHSKLKSSKYIFTPDSEYSVEEAYWVCRKCIKKN